MADAEFIIDTTFRINDASSKMKSLQSQMNVTARKAGELKAKMDELEETQVPTSKFKKLEEELDAAKRKLKELITEENSLSDMGITFGSGWDSVINKEAETSDLIDGIKAKMQTLKDNGGAYVDQTQTIGYKKLAEQLENCKDKSAVLNKRLTETARKEAKIGNKGAKSLKGFSQGMENVSKSTKKANFGMAQMLGRMILFSVAFQAFSAIADAVKEGIGNFAQYSEPFNGVISDFVSSLATLKNSLITAFAPIIETCLPYITQLINWLNGACTAVSKFIAMLQGKSTYTKAIKQTKNYAQSLKETASAAKAAGKSLAQFDSLNILQDNSSSGSGSEAGGSTGPMFEEAALTDQDFAWMDSVKDKLKDILVVAGAIGAAILAWKIASLFTSDLSKLAGIAMIAGGAVLFIASAFDAWNNGVDWKNLIGMLSGTGLIVGGLAIAFGATAAAVGAFVLGAAMIVIGIKDIIDNGVNLKNGILVVAGTFAAVVAVAGAAAGAIAALVAGIVLCVIADWENFKQTVWEPMKKWGSELLSNFTQIGDGFISIFSGIIEFFKGVFTLDWERAWNGLCSSFQGICDIIAGVFKATINIVIGVLNTAYNAITGILNAVFRAINKIELPDWLPIGGGWSPNIPTIPKMNIPYLANGTVLKGGNPYMAVINDQPAGQTNIEAPLDTIKQAVAEVTGGAGNITVELIGDAKGMFTAIVKQNKKNTMITGRNELA